MAELIFTKEDWPYGLRCMDCGDRFEEGSPIGKRLIGALSSYPHSLEDYVLQSEIVCVPCGMGLADA